MSIRPHLVITCEDGTQNRLELSRYTALKNPGGGVVLHLDKLKDESHLLIVSQDIVPEGTRIAHIHIERPPKHEHDETNLSAEQLREKYGYWQEHPTWCVDDWKSEVMNDDDRDGYWAWVLNKLIQAEEEEDG